MSRTSPLKSISSSLNTAEEQALALKFKQLDTIDLPTSKGGDQEYSSRGPLDVINESKSTTRKEELS